MSTLANSVVRGFGHTLGRAAAESVLNPNPSTPGSGLNNCYSSLGYTEGDAITSYQTSNPDNLKNGFFMYAFYLIIPFINLWVALVRLGSAYETYYLNVYKLTWQDFQIPDGRYKSGYREIKKLLPVYATSYKLDPSTSVKIHSWIGLLVSLPICIIMVMAIIEVQKAK